MFDHLSPDREYQFVSMGFVLGLLQILPGQLRVLMEGDNDPIHFSQVVDGVGYFSVADAERIAERCRDVWKEVSEVATSHQRN